MVDGLHSSHGIRRPGSPNRNTPSIATHFINSHKLCSSRSFSVTQSHIRYAHSNTNIDAVKSLCVGASRMCSGMRGSLGCESHGLRVWRVGIGALRRPKVASESLKRFAVDRLLVGGVAGNALRRRGVWSITGEFEGVVVVVSSPPHVRAECLSKYPATSSFKCVSHV